MSSTAESVQNNLTEVKSPETTKWPIIPDNRPSDYLYALMSSHAYQGPSLKVGDTLPEDDNWKVAATCHGESEYFGVLYFNQRDNHYVLAHRGTNSLAAWIEDFKGIYFGKISPQKHESYEFTKKAVTFANQTQAGLSFTGHSLGAFLADLSVFYCHRSFNFPHVNAVTFENPGSYEILLSMQSQVQGQTIDLNQLDIVGYLSCPNMINTCNHHIGTLLQLNPDLGNWGWVKGWFTKQAHLMGGILEIFDENPRPNMAKFLTDWPIGNQLSVFYTDAKFKDGRYEQALIDREGNRLFKLEYEAHYGIDETLSNPAILPMRHFGVEIQKLLLAFYSWRESVKSQKSEPALVQLMKEIKPDNIRKWLLDYSLVQKRDGEGREVTWVRLSSIDKDITQFRNGLSIWLSKLEKRQSIIALMQTNIQESTLKVISTLVGKNARVGEITDSKAIATLIGIPKDASPDDIKNANALIKQFQEGGGTIEAIGIANDAFVGRASNISAVGLEIQVGGQAGTLGQNPSTSSQNIGTSLTQFELERSRQALTLLQDLEKQTSTVEKKDPQPKK